MMFEKTAVTASDPTERFVYLLTTCYYSSNIWSFVRLISVPGFLSSKGCLPPVSLILSQSYSRASALYHLAPDKAYLVPRKLETELY